jgi:catechol 2,3-dioxygenase-like lactoylglutathione lyase family enzyme
MQLNHLNLCVDNLAEARDLFQRCFDFQFLDQKGDAIAVMTDGQGFTLVLSVPRAFGVETPTIYPEGFHVGFIAENPGQVDQIHRRLAAAADIHIDHEPRKIRESYTFYFTALNAILFEVSCPL